MSFASDDLAPLLQPDQTTGLRMGQGRILSWNPDTFENEVAWRGVVLRNLPVLSGTEALTYERGDVVVLHGWAPEDGGAGSWAIAGRYVVPGAGTAERAIQFLTTSLARSLVDSLVAELLVSPAGQELAAFIFAQRIHSETASGLVSTGSTTFTELSGGPVVTGVDVTESGRALVLLTSHILTTTSGGQLEGAMGVDISGATTVTAQDDPNLLGTNRSGVNMSSTSFGGVVGRDTAVVLFESLNSGAHTFTSVYRKFGPADEDPSFVGRNITVIAF